MAYPSVGEGSFQGFQSTIRGVAALWTRTTSAGLDFGSIQPLNNNAGSTVLVVAQPVAATNRKVAFSQRSGSGSFEQQNVIFNGDAVLGAASGALTFYTRNTAGTVSGVTSTTGVDGNLHCFVFANGTATGYIYIDGVFQTLSADTRMSGTMFSAAQKIRVGNIADYATDNAFVHSDSLLLVLAWPRVLSTSVAQQLSILLKADPSVAIEPQPYPSYSPTAAAAVGGYWYQMIGQQSLGA